MADNTCHFGINNFFAHNGLAEGDSTRLYFPADVNQMTAMLKRIFDDSGIRLIFSTRAGVPSILKEDGSELYDDKYKFEPGTDEEVRDGRDGYIVSYGDMLYRALDAVERLKEEGIDVGLINKPTLNVVDTKMMHKLASSPLVLVAESQNRETGLGIRFGSWLLEHGFKGKYARIGTYRPGEGGLDEQILFQGLDPDSIIGYVRSMHA